MDGLVVKITFIDGLLVTITLIDGLVVEITSIDRLVVKITVINELLITITLYCWVGSNDYHIHEMVVTITILLMAWWQRLPLLMGR